MGNPECSDRGGETEIEAVVKAVGASTRYKHVAQQTVRRLAERELRIAAGDQRDAIKRTKRALHQVLGAYLERPPPYARLLAEIRAAHASGKRDPLEHALRATMAHHASMRERLPALDGLHAELFRRVGPVRSLLDVACELHPLCWPWMGLPADLRYRAFDVDRAMIAFVAEVLAVLQVRAEASVEDVFAAPALAGHDVALVLKTLPVLEQQEPGSGERLLAAIDAKVLVVSFPTRSLGGRNKGMAQSYGSAFETVLRARAWSFEAFEHGPELYYVVRK